MKKLANESNRAFSKKEVQVVKKYMKKMFNNPGHKGNANQNQVKITRGREMAQTMYTHMNK
jgi:hypothetical protein